MPESSLKRRTALPRVARNNVPSYNEAYQSYMDPFFRSPKRSKQDIQQTRNEEDEMENDQKIEIGDCVLVANNDEEYVALVCNVQSATSRLNAKFTALWYYRPEDIPKEVLDTIEGGVMENEVFRSIERDINSMEHIVGKCQVISELDHRDRQNVLRLGHSVDDEDGQIFVCRYKYDPKERKIDSINEPWDIRLGLGRQEPNVGDDFQAIELPPCTKPKQNQFLGIPRWTPSTMHLEPYEFKQFLKAIDRLRFNVGAVVKYYYKYPSGSTIIGIHCRAVICKVKDKDTIMISLAAGGKVIEALKSTTSTAYTDDLAIQSFQLCQRQYIKAIKTCTSDFIKVQVEEKKKFRQELHAHLTKYS